MKNIFLTSMDLCPHLADPIPIVAKRSTNSVPAFLAPPFYRSAGSQVKGRGEIWLRHAE